MIRHTPIALACILAACAPTAERDHDAAGTNDTANTASSSEASATAGAPAPAAETFERRLAAIEAAIADWRSAPDLAAAHRAAETARNLVVGPDGPYYGDADRDGVVSGASEIGLLPGIAGQRGIVQPAANACIERDVLGGSWSDPRRRWAILDTAIEEWSPTNNPFPTLPSHPQRIVGWAGLTLDTDDLAKAREFAGHARIHSDVSRAAMECG